MRWPTWLRRDEMGRLEFWLPRHDSPFVEVHFSLPGYLAPDEWEFTRAQKAYETADGKTHVFSGAGFHGVKILRLRGLSWMELAKLQLLVERADFMAKMWEFRPQHLSEVFVARLAEPRFSFREVVPGVYESDLRVRIEDVRHYSPVPIEIKPKPIKPVEVIREDVEL